MKILVTGCAGFIGSFLAEKLVAQGHTVTGLDNINDYYNTSLKYARLDKSGIKKEQIEYGRKIQSSTLPGLFFIKLDLKDKDNLFSLFKEEKFDIVCNMAAQAGVRYSIENPLVYIDSNIYGFLNILEACRNFPVKHLVYASSSSVYGINEKTPFCVTDKTDNPVSLYAATKKSNELMAHTYSHLYNMPATGLRFFTVYGPWGRPDMAYFKFANAILNNKPIDVYNNGNMERDFTYIDDIIEGIIASVKCIPNMHAIFNLGNNHPEKLSDFIEILEKALGKNAIKNYTGMQPGDVPVTMADIDITREQLGWQPKTTISEGLKQFAHWFLEIGRYQ